MLFIFDMGGVVTTTCNVYPRLASLLGITLEEFNSYCSGENARDLYGNLFDLISDGKMTSRQFWDVFSERSGINVNTPWLHWLFHPAKMEGTAELVADLKKAGHRVVCGTNTSESHYLNHLERGDYAIFDQTYASNIMGISKPDPLFWKLILTAEDVDSDQAFFVDDKIENVEAARKLGIHAVQFESAQKLREEWGQYLKN